MRDNGKLLAEMAAQLRYVPQWYYYFARKTGLRHHQPPLLQICERLHGTIIWIEPYHLTIGLNRFDDSVAERGPALAEIEVRDNGKLLAEMAAQLRYVPQWY